MANAYAFGSLTGTISFEFKYLVLKGIKENLIKTRHTMYKRCHFHLNNVCGIIHNQ